MADTPLAGWYDDPEPDVHPRKQRRWTGAEWSDDRRTNPGALPPPSGAPAAPLPLANVARTEPVDAHPKARLGVPGTFPFGDIFLHWNGQDWNDPCNKGIVPPPLVVLAPDSVPCTVCGHLTVVTRTEPIVVMQKPNFGIGYALVAVFTLGLALFFWLVAPRVPVTVGERRYKECTNCGALS